MTMTHPAPELIFAPTAALPVDGAADYRVYTDGGCLPNKRGAWAYVILRDGVIFCEASGLVLKTDSYQMEFLAALQALVIFPHGAKLQVFTDSRILIETAERDLARWKSQGWKRDSGRPVLYPDLMRALEEVLSHRRVQWNWVRGHSRDLLNARCDEMCRSVLRPR